MHETLDEIIMKAYSDFAGQFNSEKLCEMILVANYLINEPLLELLSAKLSCDLKVKTVEEVRNFFGVADDYSIDEKS